MYTQIYIFKLKHKGKRMENSSLNIHTLKESKLNKLKNKGVVS